MDSLKIHLISHYSEAVAERLDILYIAESYTKTEISKEVVELKKILGVSNNERERKKTFIGR